MSRKAVFIGVVLLVSLMAGGILPLKAQDEGNPPADPIVIQIGVYMVGASQFDLESGMYSADFYLTMHCSRPCTADDTAFDMVGLGSAEGYNVDLRQNTDTYYEYRVQAQLAANTIDLSRFPFDVHRLKIIFESKLRTIDQVTYEPFPTETGLDDDVQLPGWSLSRNTQTEIVSKSYYGDTTYAFARMIFSFELERVAVASFIRVMLPALVILVINFVGTFIPDRNGRVGLVGGVLLAMLVHHFSVSGSIPAVAYPVYFDSFMLLNHAAILGQFGFTVCELALEKRGVAPERVDRFALVSLVGMIIVWLIAQALVLAVFQNIRIG